MNFYETSAKTGEGVNECMKNIFEQAYAYKNQKTGETTAQAGGQVIHE